MLPIRSQPDHDLSVRISNRFREIVGDRPALASGHAGQHSVGTEPLLIFLVGHITGACEVHCGAGPSVDAIPVNNFSTMAAKTIQIDARLTDGFTVESDVNGHHMYIDQSKRGGGNDRGPSPLEYLFLSLAGCLVTIAKIVAHQQKIDLRGMDVHVEGDLDSDVLLGRRDDVRAGFSDIRVSVDLDADMTHDEKVAFLQEVDRRCPISENIAHVTPFSIVVSESAAALC